MSDFELFYMITPIIGILIVGGFLVIHHWRGRK